MSLWGLHIINVIDFSLGVMVLVVSLILFTNLGDRSSKLQNAWLAYTTLVIGCMLIVVSAFSAMGVSCTWCRCSAVLSGYLAMSVGLLCFVLFVIFLAMKPLILEYFEKDGEALGQFLLLVLILFLIVLICFVYVFFLHAPSLSLHYTRWEYYFIFPSLMRFSPFLLYAHTHLTFHSIICRSPICHFA